MNPVIALVALAIYVTTFACMIIATVSLVRIASTLEKLVEKFDTDEQRKLRRELRELEGKGKE
jgi:hypothetical protein